MSGTVLGTGETLEAGTRAWGWISTAHLGAGRSQQNSLLPAACKIWANGSYLIALLWELNEIVPSI